MTTAPDIGGRDLTPPPVKLIDNPDVNKLVDETMPDGRWEFDDAVTEVFDDMLSRSIPDYDRMRSTVTAIARAALPSGGALLDVGCSRGGAIADLVELRSDCEYVGLDISPPMLTAAQDRFTNHPNVTIRRHDLRTGLPASISADVTLSILTLQFTPIEHRQRILADLRRATRGTLIIVEKVLGATADINATMVDLYYDQKRASGYTDEQIERKRLSLEGALVPVTARWNEELLATAGFTEVDCFWRHLNFAGWIAR